jgi:hypothetical protein
VSLDIWWVKVPISHELARLSHTIVHRIGCFLERQGLLERDAVEVGPMDQLLVHSITNRNAVGPQQGSKVFKLQKLPVCDESFTNEVGKVTGCSN